MSEYVSLQDRWISEGLARIENIAASHKTLARSFFDSGKIDLAAYKLLKKHLPSLAVFHLQQAAEKVAKAMLILDINDIRYNDLKNHDFICVLERLIRKHDEGKNINVTENAMFRQALTFASPKFLDFLKSDSTKNSEIYGKQIKKDIELHNEIVRLDTKIENAGANEKFKLEELKHRKEKELLDSGLLTHMLTEQQSISKILSVNYKGIKSFVLRGYDELPLYTFSQESRKALFPFFNILFITVMTYPHETYTRYPDRNGKIIDYTNSEIFKASNTIHERLYEITDRFEELNFL